MYEFNYHRPESLEAAAALIENGDDPKIVAGGMTLLPTMKQRLAAPSDLIDLAGVGGLGGVSVDAQSVTIGAMVRHVEVERSAEIRAAIPALSELAGLIGDPQVRNRGTMGGSVVNADPAADYPAAVLALKGTVVTPTREIAADAFFVELFETALEENELLTAVRFARPQYAAYMKFPNPASRYAVVGVMVAQFDDGVRVAVTGAGPCAFRVPAMEVALDKDFDASAIEGISVDDDNLNADIHASAEYRAHLVGVMARRAVTAAKGR
jgi:carbon-monoxide dehydrogenase medium subunit